MKSYTDVDHRNRPIQPTDQIKEMVAYTSALSFA